MGVTIKRRDRRRAGFTMIELITVITIIAIISSIVIAGVMGFGKGTRLTIAETLITDFLRQARHTARSSGAPVILRLTQTTAEDGRVVGGEISGISQVSLASESFENDELWQSKNNLTGGSAGSSENTDPPKPFAVGGRSGHGLRIEASNGQLTFPSQNNLAVHYASSDRSKRLVRRPGRTEGFYLSAAIRTPLVENPVAVNPGTPGKVSTYLPVVLIGSNSGPQLEQSVAGLLLRRHQRPMQIVDRWNEITQTATMNNLLAHPLATWEAVGWVKGDDGSGAMVTSVDDLAFQQALGQASSGGGTASGQLHISAKWTDYQNVYRTLMRKDPLRTALGSQQPLPWNAIAMDIPQPIGDGRWADLGLLYDGRELELFLDGVPIARAEAAINLPYDDNLNTLWIGAAEMPTLGTDPASGATVYAQAPAVIDDVRLFRLGTDRPTPLPKGVRFCGLDKVVHQGNALPVEDQGGSSDNRYELVVWPDGRVALLLLTRVNGTSVAVRSDNLSIILAETSAVEFATDPHATPARRVEIYFDASGKPTIRRLPNGP